MPIATISPHHIVRLFFSKVDELFVIGDKVVRVEHTNVESRTLIWKLVQKESNFGILNMKIRCNMGCNNFLLELSL